MAVIAEDDSPLNLQTHEGCSRGRQVPGREARRRVLGHGGLAEFEGAFAAIAVERVGALVVLDDAFLIAFG
jgi:hypothetical protein